MPIYEYKCNQCDNTFEYLVLSADEKENPACTACGSEDTCRQMSSFSCNSTGGKGGLGTISSSCSAPSGGFS